MDSKIKKIVDVISAKKGTNTVVIDIKNISSITDYVIIAEGRVNIHIKSILDGIVKELKKEKISPYKIEYEKESGWIIIDYQNVMVHLFIPFFREKYNLEELLEDGKIISV